MGTDRRGRISYRSEVALHSTHAPFAFSSFATIPSISTY